MLVITIDNLTVVSDTLKSSNAIAVFMHSLTKHYFAVSCNDKV